jgi:HAE1 family hydrophobic/amphiphilic exporter-1
VEVRRDAAADLGLNVTPWPARCAPWWPARRWATGAPADDQTYDVACAWRPGPRQPRPTWRNLPLVVGSNADGSAARRAPVQVADVRAGTGPTRSTGAT